MRLLHHFIQRKYHYVLVISGCCLVFANNISIASDTEYVYLAQQTHRVPEIVTGQLTSSSPILPLTFNREGHFHQSHSFEGVAGETITISLTSNEFDTYLIVEKPDGAWINGIGTTSSSMTTTLPDNGTYRIIVKGWAPYETGRYRLEWRAATLAEQELMVADQLNRQLITLQEEGRYADAIPLAENALKIREQHLSPNHLDVSDSLDQLASLYRLMNRYSEAEPLLVRVLAINERQFEPNNPIIATSLNNLAELYHVSNRYEDAESLFKRALAIREQVLESNHPNIAVSLNNLASLYVNTYQYDKAEPLLKRALAIKEEQLEPNDPSLAISLNNLAFFYQVTRQFRSAKPLYERALKIRQNYLGGNHPLTAQSLNNLARLYYSQGQPLSALDYLKQGLEIQETVLSQNLVGGSDTDKLNYIDSVVGQMYVAISLHLNDLSGNSEASHFAYTTILQRKGRVLDLFTNIRAQLGKDPTALTLLDELSTVSTQLANLTFNISTELTLEIYQKQLSAIQGRFRNLEDQLSRLSQTFADTIESPDFDLIQATLPDGTALIEFIRYHPFNPQASTQGSFGEPRYAAYVLQPNGIIRGIDLGSAATIDAAVSDFSNNLISPDTPQFQLKESSQALNTLIMSPVRDALGDITTVFLSPDSALNLIPFEALVDENNNYLVERYQFRYLTSGRDLIRIANTPASKNPAVLMGDPTFSRADETIRDSFDVAQRAIDLENNIFPSLDGTEAEIQEIAKRLNVEPYLRTTATEAQLKAIDSPRILHVATHGFFKVTDDNTSNTSNPLLQSGLVLAGVKERQSGPEEDGILTALEVTGMNLQGTQLTVLSACETGLGEITAGEGIYGLRRALVLAGTQSQVISLWKVDDIATQELMVDYYDRLLTGAPRDKALRETQLAFLEHEDYGHPYYWSAFIGSGDWRPLD